MRVDISRDVTKMSNNKNSLSKSLLKSCCLFATRRKRWRFETTGDKSALCPPQGWTCRWRCSAATEDFNSNSFHFLFCLPASPCLTVCLPMSVTGWQANKSLSDLICKSSKLTTPNLPNPSWICFYWFSVFVAIGFATFLLIVAMWVFV